MPLVSPSVGIGGGFFPGGLANGGVGGGAPTGKFNVLQCGVAATNAAGNAAAMNALGTIIPASGGTAYWPAGLYRVDGNVTFGANITHEFAPGAVLVVDAGKTLTINGPMLECVAQRFGGAGRVVLGGGITQVFPQWWGAKGDGVNDDTAAIQAAINVAQALNYTTVYLPQQSNLYKITAPLVISGPIRLKGAHEGVAIRATGFAADTYVLDINGNGANLEHVVVEDLMLLSDNHAPDLVRLNWAAVCTMRNVRLFYARHGVVITGPRGHDNLFERVEAYGLSGNAWYFLAFDGGGQETLLGCSATSCNNGVVVAADATVSQLSLIGTLFETCATSGISAVGNVYGLAVQNCRFEKNTRDLDVRPVAGCVAYGVTVIGSFFNSNNVAFSMVIGGGGGPVRGFVIMGNYAEVYATAFILLNGEGQSGQITGNRVHLCPAIVNAIRPGVLVVNNEGDGGTIGAVWNPPLATPVIASPAGGATIDAQARAAIDALRAALSSVGITA